MIQITDVHKSFGDTQALNNISLSIDKGELFGLIGPDGAGKSTLFNIMTTLLMPDKGEVLLDGMHSVRDYKKIRRILGYMPGRFSLYQDLTVQENLNFFAAIFGTTVEENYELIEEIYVQLEPFKKRRASDLSGGMKQKLALCCALVHEPRILFLDEPTTGVDAVSRAEFWDMLYRLKAKGITVMVSTPYMDEASRCERIALIQLGNILRIDTPDAICSNYGKPLYAVRSDDFYRLLQDLKAHEVTQRVEPFGEYLHLTTNADVDPNSLKTVIKNMSHTDIEVKPIEATIEDVFLDLM